MSITWEELKSKKIGCLIAIAGCLNECNICKAGEPPSFDRIVDALCKIKDAHEPEDIPGSICSTVDVDPCERCNSICSSHKKLLSEIERRASILREIEGLMDTVKDKLIECSIQANTALETGGENGALGHSDVEKGSRSPIRKALDKVISIKNAFDKSGISSAIREELGALEPSFNSTLAYVGQRGQEALDSKDEAGEREYGRVYLLLRSLQESCNAVYEYVEAEGVMSALTRPISEPGLSYGTDMAPETSAILRIINIAEQKLRKAFQDIPSDEKEVQHTFEILLIGADIPYSREKDHIKYSSKTYIPDFTIQELDLAIEIKFCKEGGREKSIIGEINDDMLAYRTKYEKLLFVVYDLGNIRDAEAFTRDFEENNVVVRVVKH